MLTPNGDYVRNLSPEEEERYLQLQANLAESAGPASFISGKHNASNGFTLIGGRAVPNGPPSFFPAPAGTIPPLDPVSKIQRDEALSYINQYVLPSLSTNKQLENALNANALDNFPSWGGSEEAGVLASGIDGMTAHFAVGGNSADGGIGGGGRPLGNVSLLGCREAESAMVAARKEAEGIEKRLTALVKKNKRLLLGSGH
jgi:CCR4-NOT transcription complex subunit 4